MFFGTDMHQSIVNQIQLKFLLYILLRLTRMNFSSTMSVPVFTRLQQEYKMATRQLKADLYLSFGVVTDNFQSVSEGIRLQK